jgi:hypothetical protein
MAQRDRWNIHLFRKTQYKSSHDSQNITNYTLCVATLPQQTLLTAKHTRRFLHTTAPQTAENCALALPSPLRNKNYDTLAVFS